MGRPSNEQLLQRALEEGDVEKAQELVAKIARKNKPNTKQKVKSPTPKQKVIVENTSSFIVPSRPNGAKSVGSDPDKNYGKKIGWEDNWSNNFNDQNVLRKAEETQVKKFDKKHALPVSERTRPPAKKVDVKCQFCGREEQVSEVLGNIVIGGHKSPYTCNRCCGRG